MPARLWHKSPYESEIFHCMTGERMANSEGGPLIGGENFIGVSSAEY
jgi:hypothetical protein